VEHLLDLDRKVFLWINTQWASPPLDTLFSVVTWLGSAWVVIVVAVILLALKERTAVRQHLPWLLLALLLGGICIHVLKRIVDRPRPINELAPLIEAGKIHIRIVGEGLRLKSFPSGHAQTVFTAGVYLSCLFRRASPGLLSAACAVGISRIYLGVHFPLDVVAGALIGTICAIGMWFLRQRIPLPRLFKTGDRKEKQQAGEENSLDASP